MALDITLIDQRPDDSYSRGPHASPTRTIIDQLFSNPTKTVAVQADTSEELQKLYKALIQWRCRHRDRHFTIQKRPDRLFLFLPDQAA